MHDSTVMLAASGTSGFGFWVFVAAVILGFAFAGVWAFTRLRANGYLERAQPTIDVFPDLYAEEDLPTAA